MLLSQNHKILYVANPKTATTAVQKWLLSEDGSFKKTIHKLNGKSVILSEHITALEAKSIIGEKYYNDLFVFGFVRLPISKMISSYYFYKQAEKNRKLWDPNTKRIGVRVKNLLQYLIAKTLPLNIWLIFYPYKNNFRYFTDYESNVIVKNIGRFEFLKKDLKRILEKTSLDLDFEKLAVINKSEKASGYSISPLMMRLLCLRHPKLKKDMLFYKKVELDITNEGSN
jgi:hypothetical protein